MMRTSVEYIRQRLYEEEKGTLSFIEELQMEEHPAAHPACKGDIRKPDPLTGVLFRHCEIDPSLCPVDRCIRKLM